MSMKAYQYTTIIIRVKSRLKRHRSKLFCWPSMYIIGKNTTTAMMESYISGKTWPVCFMGCAAPSLYVMVMEKGYISEPLRQLCLQFFLEPPAAVGVPGKPG